MSDLVSDSVPGSFPVSVPAPVPRVSFLPVSLYFVNEKKHTLSRFAIVDNLPDMLDILQILLDRSENGLNDVIGIDEMRPGKALNAARLASHYGLRSRSYEERINNTRTYAMKD